MPDILDSATRMAIRKTCERESVVEEFVREVLVENMGRVAEDLVLNTLTGRTGPMARALGCKDREEYFVEVFVRGRLPFVLVHVCSEVSSDGRGGRSYGDLLFVDVLAETTMASWGLLRRKCRTVEHRIDFLEAARILESS